MRALSASIGRGSPWTRQVSVGGCLKLPSQRMISLESACADIESIASILARTGTSSPWMRVNLAPSLQRAAARARCLIAGKQHGVARIRQARACRWCSTRPPVAMPLDEITIDGSADSCTCRDSAIVAITFSRAVAEQRQLLGCCAPRRRRRWNLRVELVGALAIFGQHGRRHRAVDIDGQFRNRAAFLEPFDPVQQFFDAAERKRRNDQLAPRSTVSFG